jgi:hypothetical protein
MEGRGPGSTGLGTARDYIAESFRAIGLTLGGEAPKFDPEAQAMILKVAGANVGPGITAHLFYFAPGKDGVPDDFGLILDAEPAVVAKALPQYAQSRIVNGYRRELTAIGDPDGSGEGKGKSLLVCRAGGLSGPCSGGERQA